MRAWLTGVVFGCAIMIVSFGAEACDAFVLTNQANSYGTTSMTAQCGSDAQAAYVNFAIRAQGGQTVLYGDCAGGNQQCIFGWGGPAGYGQIALSSLNGLQVDPRDEYYLDAVQNDGTEYYVIAGPCSYGPDYCGSARLNGQ